MTAARKPKPNPASVTTRKRAMPERGTTSPSPRVKKVVPLKYMSVERLEFKPVVLTAEPAPYCIMPKANTSPTAQTPIRKSNEIGPKKPRNVSRGLRDEIIRAYSFQLFQVSR